MSVRLFHRGARWVLAVRGRWLAIHRTEHRWDRIFTRALEILDLPVDPTSPVSSNASDRMLPFGQGYGEVRWTPRRYWTRIDLCLRQGSPRKRQLIAAALLKAARYQVMSPGS